MHYKSSFCNNLCVAKIASAHNEAIGYNFWFMLRETCSNSGSSHYRQQTIIEVGVIPQQLVAYWYHMVAPYSFTSFTHNMCGHLVIYHGMSLALNWNTTNCMALCHTVQISLRILHLLFIFEHLNHIILYGQWQRASTFSTIPRPVLPFIQLLNPPLDSMHAFLYIYNIQHERANSLHPSLRLQGTRHSA